MNRLRALSIVTALVLTAPIRAQDEDLTRRLQSPLAAERALAAQELAAGAWPVDRLSRLVEGKVGSRLRMAVAGALAAREGDDTALDALEAMASREGDPRVGAAIARAVFHLRVRGGTLWETRPIPSTLPGLRDGAREFVRDELSQLAAGGCTWSRHRRLASFAAMGGHEIEALEGVVDDRSLGSPARGLAVIALSRVDSRSFWVDEKGAPTTGFLRRLDKGDPTLRAALLYGAAWAGRREPLLVQRVVDYACNEAFDVDQIQAALYYLYTLPDAVLEKERSRVRPVLEEFLHLGYSGRALYNAGELLKRLRDPDLARDRLEAMTKEPGFHSYWLIVGIVQSIETLPPEEQEPILRPLLERLLRSDDSIPPQLRGLAGWYWKDRHGSFPPGFDLEAQLAAIRASTAAIHTENEDSDQYAQRSGLEILSLLGDPDCSRAVEPMLTHANEAVRMMAGLAAGNAHLTGLRESLLRVIEKDDEFAAYGAAHALASFGDPAAIDGLLGILESGNAVLQPAALADLATLIRPNLATVLPESKAEWRAVARSIRDSRSGGR